MQVSVLGGGLAGALLAWRLARQPGVGRVSLAPGPARDRDATAASGGAVRGYEIEAAAAAAGDRQPGRAAGR